MTGIQLIAIVFGVAMAFWTYRDYRRRALLAAEAAVWFTVWVGLILVSLLPDELRNLVGPLKVARLLDLVMIAGILLLSTLVFMLNVRIRRLESRVVELVRRLALSAEEPRGDGKESIREVHRNPRDSAE
jgi:hypothetical protein